MNKNVEELRLLAELIRQRNQADEAIARCLGRPIERGHVGELIASRVLGIELNASATHKGADGRFATGALGGRSVNIKFYGNQEGLLDLVLNAPPDFYLVLTGPKSSAASSRGAVRPLVIESVFLFETEELCAELRARGLKLGVATSVAGKYWEMAEIYPRSSNSQLALDLGQRELLSLFAS